MVKWLPRSGLAVCVCAALMVTLAAPGTGAAFEGAASEEAAARRSWRADVEPTQEGNVASVARELLVRANDERVERGAGPLDVDADLEAFAVAHSRRMARDARTQPMRRALSHSDDRARGAAGGNGEIVATQAGSDAAAEVHVSAMRSDPHREILLAADAGRVGVGVACQDDRVWVTYVSDGGRDRGVPEQPVVRDDAAELGCDDRDQAGEGGQAGDEAREDAGDGKVVERHDSEQPGGPDSPGQVEDLRVIRLADSSLRLSWSAVEGGDGAPAGDYVVTQVREPADVEDGGPSDLCDGVCRFQPSAVGQRLSLTVGPLEPETTYRYRLRPVDASGQPDPVSDEAQETTTPASLSGLCPGEHVAPAPFADRGAIPEPHRDNVDCAFFHQIGAGYDDGAYHPGWTVRRDHMATFVVDTLSAAGVELPPADTEGFADVAADSPHADAINRLAAAGLVAGGPQGRSQDAYGPALGLRRDQLASFLVRALEYARDASLEPDDARRFDDVSPANPHADNAAVAAEHGLTPGVDTDTYRPEAATHRDQLATFLIRLLRATER